MTFSVIVPFFNEEKYIRECIYSLLNQDFNKNEYELIFVNNGSTDGSEKIVKQFDSIIMIYEEKKNPYTARNRALEITKGSIIAFTDADCIVCPDWLRQIYRGIKDSNADIVLGKVKFFKKRSLLLRIAEDYRNSRIDYLLSHGYHRSCFGYTNNMAVKSHIFATLGVFKEWPVPGDTEIIQRCLLRYPSFKITYIMSMEVVHMELSTLATWIKKTFLHGRHSVLLKKNKICRSPSFLLRLRIISNCCKKNNYNFFYKFLAIFLLSLSSLFFQIGKLVGGAQFHRIKKDSWGLNKNTTALA